MTDRRFPVLTRDGSPMTIPWAVAVAALIHYSDRWQWCPMTTEACLFPIQNVRGGFLDTELDTWLTGTEHENWREVAE